MEINNDSSTCRITQKPLMLVCPKCFGTCPLIKFLFIDDTINLDINCSICPPQSISLFDYVDKALIKPLDMSCNVNQCLRHAARFCTCNSHWYCHQCLQSHTPLEQHIQYEYSLSLKCSDHNKCFKYYCFDCHKNICNKCKKGDKHQMDHVEPIETLDMKKIKRNFDRLIDEKGLIDVYKTQREKYIDQTIINELDEAYDRNKKLNDGLFKLLSAAMNTYNRLYENSEKEFHYYELMKFFEEVEINVINNKGKFPSMNINNNIRLLINYYHEEFIIKPNQKKTYQCLQTLYTDFAIDSIIHLANGKVLTTHKDNDNDLIFHLRNQSDLSLIQSYSEEEDEIKEKIASVLQLTNRTIAVATSKLVYIYGIDFKLLKIIKDEFDDLTDLLQLSKKDVLFTVSHKKINAIHIDKLQGKYTVIYPKIEMKIWSCCIVNYDNNERLVVSGSKSGCNRLIVYDNESLEKIEDVLCQQEMKMRMMMIKGLDNCGFGIMAGVGMDNVVRIWRKFAEYENALNNNEQNEVVCFEQIDSRSIAIGYKDKIDIWNLEGKSKDKELRCKMDGVDLKGLKMMRRNDKDDKDDRDKLMARYENYVKIWNV